MNSAPEVEPAGVLGLMTTVATWQLVSVVLAAQFSPFFPPVPSSQVMKSEEALSREGAPG